MLQKNPTDARRALARLREGNARFSTNVRCLDTMAGLARRAEHLDGQAPFAVVLSCSDSRVPSEMVFDCGLGHLFVVRVAGNVVAPSLVGSVEFAVAKLGTPLAVVMGHSGCGAVTATLDALGGDQPASLSDNIRDIVERISPAVAELARLGLPREELVRAAVRANVRASVEQLRRGSRLLEERLAEGELLVVGAEYSLETGEVEFFDGLGALSG